MLRSIRTSFIVFYTRAKENVSSCVMSWFLLSRLVLKCLEWGLDRLLMGDRLVLRVEIRHAIVLRIEIRHAIVLRLYHWLRLSRLPSKVKGGRLGFFHELLLCRLFLRELLLLQFRLFLPEWLLLPQWLFLSEWLHKGLFYWLLLLEILLLSRLVGELLLDRLRKHILLWTLGFLLVHERLFLERVRFHWLLHKGLLLLPIYRLLTRLLSGLLSGLLVARLLLLLLELVINKLGKGLLMGPVLDLRVSDAEQVCELLRGCVLLLLLPVPLLAEHVQPSLLVPTRGCARS